VGWYTDQVVPRAIDLLMRDSETARVRNRVAASLDGEVLEVGFGSGLNVPHYPAGITRVRAVDPATVGRKLAARRTAASPVPVDFVGLDAQRLPVADGSVDHVLCTWTLCTIPDVKRALAEIGRVLRPGGSLHFAEHGLAPDPKVARLQHRFTPLQRRVAGGCHLDRPIDKLIAGSGLAFERLETYYMRGPKAWCYTFEGSAVKDGTGA
jgi:ubiquinone/menaquinone biosynthesis C-methylase UbiE